MADTRCRRIILNSRYRKPLGIVDSSNRLFMVFLKKPAGASDWDECVGRAYDRMVEAREKGLASGAWTQKLLDHNRGNFLAINSGVSFGGGPTVSTKPPMDIPGRLLTAHDT